MSFKRISSGYKLASSTSTSQREKGERLLNFSVSSFYFSQMLHSFLGFSCRFKALFFCHVFACIWEMQLLICCMYVRAKCLVNVSIKKFAHPFFE